MAQQIEYLHPVYGETLATVAPWKGRQDSWGRGIEYGRCEANSTEGRLSWALCRREAVALIAELGGVPTEAVFRCYCARHLAAARRRSRYNLVIYEEPIIETLA